MSMKKILLTVCMLAIITLPCMASAQSDDIISPLNSGDTRSPVQSTGQLYDILILIVQWVYTVLFVIAVLFILIAAYNFITGAQSEDKIKSAKAQLKYAVIAMAIGLVASGVVAIVKGVLESSPNQFPQDTPLPRDGR